MKQEVLKNFEHIDLTLVGLMVFVLFFSGMLLWVFRRGSKKLYDEAAQLPLQSNSGDEK